MLDPVTPEEVESHLNVLEKLTRHLEGEDNYQAAMLKNQGMLIRALRGSSSGVAGGVFGGIDKDDLPVGMVGEVIEPGTAGETVRSVFNVAGTRFVTDVELKEDAAYQDIVYVTGSNNTVVVSEDLGATSEFDGTQPNPNEVDANYYSESEIAVDTEEEQEIKFGFVAEAIIVHGFDQQIVIALKDTEAEHRDIILDASDSPFSIAGVTGVETGKLWYRKPTGGTDTTLDVLALG